MRLGRWWKSRSITGHVGMWLRFRLRNVEWAYQEMWAEPMNQWNMENDVLEHISETISDDRDSSMFLFHQFPRYKQVHLGTVTRRWQKSEKQSMVWVKIIALITLIILKNVICLRGMFRVHPLASKVLSHFYLRYILQYIRCGSSIHLPLAVCGLQIEFLQDLHENA